VAQVCDASVVFNLFFEAEPFVAILIAHGTHELSKECVLGTLPRPGGQKFKAEGRDRVWGYWELPASRGYRGAL